MGLASNQVLGDGQQIGGGRMEKNQLQQQRMPRLRCPRCDSNNTKFCYYNNYSRAQPRHYCRACRRHWTDGGTLRNVPVGGGRKSKQSKTTSTTTTGTLVQQAVAPPADGEVDSGILSNIFRSVLFYPPVVTSDHAGGLISSPAVISNDVGVAMDPLPISNSSSSSSSPPYSNQTTQDSVPEDALLTLMPGSEASTWLQDPPPLPASYYWTWWDETADFVSAGLEHHPVIAPQYP